MDKTLRALYSGEIRPCEKAYPTDEVYRELAEQFEAQRAELVKLLDEKGAFLLTELLELHMEMCTYTDVEDFISGFRLGARIVLEILDN